MRNILLANCLFLFFSVEAATYGDLVFSELMTDPEPTVGLPAVEYVEICNRTSSIISLAGWTLVYGDKSYALPNATLSAGAYLVLCAKTSVFPPDIPTLGMTSFPTLVNAGKFMALLSPAKEPVCCLEYSDSWFGSAFKTNGGWSLECIDLSNFSGSGSNWAASLSNLGGTPGRSNSIQAVNPAVSQPRCQRVYVPSPNTVELHFSEFMQPATLSNVLNYSLEPEQTLVVSATLSSPDSRVVTIRLSDTLVSGMEYRLSLSGLQSYSGIDLPDTTLSLGLPEKAEAGTLQLNELLFNPKPGGCDYVEFVHTGTKCVDLSDVWLTTRSPSGSLNAGRRLSEKPLPCLPGSYWLVTESVDSVCRSGPFPKMPNVIELTGIPSMPDEAGSVVLVTTSAEIIDETQYDESMHFALITQPEGVALEKVRPDAPSSRPSNWVSATATAHYGTPGFPNSNLQSALQADENAFFAKQTWLTPNNDGRDDRICIQYVLPERCAGSLRLFNLQGRLVRTLANNEVLGTTGSYWWDGMLDDATPAPPGRYILFAEAFTPKGRVIRKRLVLTVLF